MTSENYRELLNNEYKVNELNQEEFNDTLIHFAMLYHKEQLDLYSVSHCYKGGLYEEFQKGYKKGYEDGTNSAVNDIAENPHKMY